MTGKVGEFSLTNKVAVVTGGGSGINLEYARRIHAQGCHVIIGDVRLVEESKSWLQSVKDEPTKALYQKTDVINWDDLKALINRAHQEFGKSPDLYVAGAGVFEPSFSNFWEDPESDFYRELAINTAHPIKLTRMAIQELLPNRKKGVVVIVGSVAGQVYDLSGPIYVASKHAVSGFTRSLTLLDEKYGIKVVSLAPGPVKSRLFTDRPEFMKMHGITDEISMTPGEMADEMVNLTTSAQYGGGTVLEVMKGMPPRNVPGFNADPPAGMHTEHVVTNAVKKVFDLLDKERDGGSE
ncbi:uncharacterized protein TRUGW13939_10594 [Talaromyces rugulosus]|uniref:Uncharacterized protein n=1 Tax=Talaromyces rugulosus TaxID=121627 RepID=A0A7H8RAH0_TALRU|nr:uncharacterized protein TRUGW13939_10594 [Talaromyces rugulosus]QKX63424.1 hypothetical protein TRUGW13939_10594 [Talaromyces rugulosus]